MLVDGWDFEEVLKQNINGEVIRTYESPVNGFCGIVKLSDGSLNKYRVSIGIDDFPLIEKIK